MDREGGVSGQTTARKVAVSVVNNPNFLNPGTNKQFKNIISYQRQKALGGKNLTGNNHFTKDEMC